ncbi:MAG: RIO1 family regulatory kinase/ATPase domain-containing protein [Candidatus Helarchaeota archaeon]
MQIKKLIKTIKRLIINDYRVLGALERGMAVHEFVPIETITNFSGLNINEVNYRLSYLHKLELIKRWTGPYIGYYLTSAGYDSLALHALIEANELDLFGKAIGVGKESDVFDAINANGQNVAVKIHRLGRTSFRQTKRKRSYSKNRKHISWLYQSRLAAQKEFEALKILKDDKLSVPMPYACNRHIIVMERIEGIPLFLVKDLPEKERILNDILDNIFSAFSKANIIHGDLSEYNIIITPNLNIMIIDWPQWVKSAHPNFKFYLKRDINNILKFFKRKYDVFRDENIIFKEFF